MVRRKDVLFDIDTAILFRGLKQDELNPEFRMEIHRLREHKVRAFAIGPTDDESWARILEQFPVMDGLFIDVLQFDNTRLSDLERKLYDQFFARNSIDPTQAIYFYSERKRDDQRYSNFYNKELGFSYSFGVRPGNAYSCYALYTRLVANGVYWPEATAEEVIVTASEQSLAGQLLRHIALFATSVLNRREYESQSELFPQVFENWAYSDIKQRRAARGARFTHQHMSAWEGATDALERFDLLTDLSSTYYELRFGAHEIPAVIEARERMSRKDLDHVFYHFFRAYSDYDDRATSEDLPSYFERAGFADLASDEWLPTTTPYFVGGFPPWSHKEQRILNPREFFSRPTDRIV